MAYAAVEPWGFAAADLHHGHLCATVLAPHMGKGRRADPRDFMFRPPPEVEMSPAQTEAMLDVLFGVRPVEPSPVRAPTQD